MELSKLFTKTTKDVPSDDPSINARLLTQAGYVQKTMAGVYNFLPLGLKVLRNIEQIVREEMDAIGAQEVLLSSFAPKEFWEKTDRWDQKKFDALFHVPAAGDHEYALNPTHEEVVTPMAKQFVHSYKDLPFGCYQIQTKFRNELRARSGLLRGREFLMKDLYSFHENQKDLEAYYETVKGAYDKVFARLGLENRTYFTYASGGSFSQYSHEYQVVMPSGEDTIYISEEAEKQGMRIAINREIYEEGKTVCPVTGGKSFREERAAEAGNIFQLGTRFSDAFDLGFADAQGARQHAWMGCYGIGISRLMGIIAECFSDERGLIWPAHIAPFQCHIVVIAKAETDDAYVKATELYTMLHNAGMQCVIDNRFKASTGEKLADAELLGIPLRILVSPKSLEQQSVELQWRHENESTLVPLSELSVESINGRMP